MATVFRAEHIEGGDQRALKLLHGDMANEEIRTRFEAEFRTMQSLQHPNICRVFDTGVQKGIDGGAWFAMELVEGRDLREELEIWKTLPGAERAERAEGVLVQIASALAHIHERGLVHRDVTPGNILIRPDGISKLMDFGVVHTPGAELTMVGQMVGTVAYIAPEQIDPTITGGRVDARADLYALGVVLYVMLTGRRPFNATTIPSLLEKHLNARPRPPREVVPTVPHHLDEACRRLLEKDPARRFGSARHLLAVLDRRAAAIEEMDLKRWPDRIVGRTAELARLREAVSAVDSGRGSALMIEGPSGFGKSVLLKALEQQATEQGLRVLRGRCRRGGGIFSGFVEIVRALANPLPPPLDVVFGESQERLEHYRVHTAVRDLLRSAGPIVVMLDSLHNADRGTLELLAFLVRNHLELAEDPVLLVCTRRSPERSSEDLLRDLEKLERQVLEPITPTAVEELLLQVVPADERARILASRLCREGEGNPHFICEMIRGLVSQGIIRRDDKGWGLSLDLADLSQTRLPVPASIRDALQQRLRALSPPARELARLLAICRHEVPIDMLVQALHTTEENIYARIEELLENDVVRTRSVGMEELFDLTAGRLRDVLIAQLEGTEGRSLHQRAGAALERHYRHRLNSVVETIAWHFEQGEVPAKAYPYLLRAGIRLQDRNFVPEALDYFDRAMALEPDAREYMTLDDADRRLGQLRMERGMALFHLGRWAEAEREHVQADGLALETGDDRLRTRTLTELGGYARRRHDLDLAEERLTEALTMAIRLGDTSLRVQPLQALGGVRWSRGDLNGARQMWLEALNVAGTVRDDKALGKGHSGLGLVALCRGQAAEARKYLEQACVTFERLGQVSPLAVARINLVELYHCTGNLRKALQLADRTVAQAREIRYLYGVALGLQYRALILVDLGRLGEAEESASEALNVLTELDIKADALPLHISLVRVALARKDYLGASKLLELTRRDFAEFDTEGYAPLITAFEARCAAELGNPEDVHAKLKEAEETAGRPWPHQRCRLDVIAARALMAVGDDEGACLRASAALSRADGSGFRFYSLKAHTILAAVSTEESDIALHKRVANALARSLAANLSREDAETFLAAHSV